MGKRRNLIAFAGLLGSASALSAGCIDLVAEYYTPLTDPALADAGDEGGTGGHDGGTTAAATVARPLRASRARTPRPWPTRAACSCRAARAATPRARARRRRPISPLQGARQGEGQARVRMRRGVHRGRDGLGQRGAVRGARLRDVDVRRLEEDAAHGRRRRRSRWRSRARRAGPRSTTSPSRRPMR